MLGISATRISCVPAARCLVNTLEQRVSKVSSRMFCSSSDEKSIKDLQRLFYDVDPKDVNWDELLKRARQDTASGTVSDDEREQTEENVASKQ